VRVLRVDQTWAEWVISDFGLDLFAVFEQGNVVKLAAASPTPSSAFSYACGP
jgi:hypothetical protein